MPNVVNVRFRNRGKSYYYDPGELQIDTGDSLVVETSKGLELGECVEGCHEVPEDGVVQPLKSVVRVATADDLRIAEANRRKENAFDMNDLLDAGQSYKTFTELEGDMDGSVKFIYKTSVY